MGKCRPCSDGICGREYRNRYKCEDRENCTCTCQESSDDTVGKASLSILGGAAAITGGVALTVLTGGLGAVFGGAALIGAGTSMAANPISKKISGERMTGKDYITDVAVGTVVGAATGGLGAAGSAATQGASGVVKGVTRVGVGATSGAIGGFYNEVGKAVKGEKTDSDSMVKSLATGAITGGFGGGASHLASNLSKVGADQVCYDNFQVQFSKPFPIKHTSSNQVLKCPNWIRTDSLLYIFSKM